MSARTRRQKAALAAQGDESEDSGNSNGNVSTPSKKTPSKKQSRSKLNEQPKENVFLFAPNLIGKLTYASMSEWLSLIAI